MVLKTQSLRTGKTIIAQLYCYVPLLLTEPIQGSNKVSRLVSLSVLLSYLKKTAGTPKQMMFLQTLAKNQHMILHFYSRCRRAEAFKSTTPRK